MNMILIDFQTTNENNYVVLDWWNSVGYNSQLKCFQAILPICEYKLFYPWVLNKENAIVFSSNIRV